MGCDAMRDLEDFRCLSNVEVYVIYVIAYRLLGAP